MTTDGKGRRLLLHRRGKSLFTRALEIAEGQRDAFVVDACGGDGELLDHVRRLLQHAGGDTDDWRPAADQIGAIGGAATYRREPVGPLLQPGDRVAGRYRVERRLGGGGMGEVYLADDDLLEQRVALKLPLVDPPEVTVSTSDALGGPGGAHRRLPHPRVSALLDEARAARGVVDPRVCRVFDAGEHRGLPFLTLEFIEGQDLGQRIRRGGPLTADGLLRLARQISGGLAAIHGSGLLHRDLKPANVLLDHRGDARLTDFGIAIRRDDRSPALAGTHGYLAPEVLAGEPPSPQSDLFALGVVLYAAATGRQPAGFPASPTPPPSHLGIDIDPALERVIAACLEPDPDRRPPSAEAVAEALALDDPLAAVLALGERPSPAVLAASKAKGVLDRRRGFSVAALTLLLTAAFLVLLPKVRSLDRAGLGVPVGQRVSAARVLVDSLLPDRPIATADWDYGRLDGERIPGAPYPPGMVAAGQDIYFCHRDSAFDLVNWNALDLAANGGRVQLFEPAPSALGSTTACFDPAGSLFFFQHTPAPLPAPEEAAEERDAPSPDGDMDWGPLFDAAGLDFGRFTEVEPNLPLATSAHRRIAWRSKDDGDLGVEAGSRRGLPVFFTAFRLASAGDGAAGRVARQEAAFGIAFFAAPLLLLLVAWPAWRNLRAGRGDPWGAFRLAVGVCAAVYAAFLLQADLPRDPPMAAVFAILGLAGPLLQAAGIWLLYMGGEPLMQRFWPRSLVSWSRLLHPPDGRPWRDPIAASHMLIGAAAGVGFAFARLAETAWTARALRLDLPVPAELPSALPTPARAAATLLELPFDAAFLALLMTVLLGLCRWLFRREAPAAAVAVALFSLEGLLAAPVPWASFVCFVLGQNALGYAVFRRWGLLPLMVAFAVAELMVRFPWEVQSGGWTLWATAVAAAALGAAVLLPLRALPRVLPQT
ncbi:MAG: serine/threonine-protein kinase [Acidobacteriota bacterium]